MKRSLMSSERSLGKGKYLQFIKKGEWEYFRRINCSDIVIIAALTDDLKVIFVEQYRPPVDKKVIEFPAGLLNDSKGAYETLIKGAKRELLEETGYVAQKIVKLLKGPVSSGASADLVTMVIASGLKKITAGGGVEGEGITVHEVEWDRVDKWLLEMQRRGRLIEPKIYSGLYLLAKYNKLNF
jgi:ADP-ribose pyrophosphatase